jgi:3-dehydrotetronate 4-kinase
MSKVRKDRTMLLGCIADDLTGATDLALMLTRAGMRTVQVMGVPDANADFTGFDAVVVALKSRTNPPADAVAWSLAAADVLLARGARQLFFKYCSTFDSTDQGNIGPVADALMERVDPGGIAIVCPAFPANKRTIFNGHLFVGDVLLSDSPMKDHPLTPMRDANLVRVLQRQTKSKVALVALPDVMGGVDHLAYTIREAANMGARFVVVDAVIDEHLLDIGRAIGHCNHMPVPHKLITGGSGIAMGLPRNFIDAGLMQASAGVARLAAPKGRQLIIAGSCSQATRGQVKAAIAVGIPAFEVDALSVAAKKIGAVDLVAWAKRQPASGPVLIYSSAEPARVAEIQKEFGRDASGAMIEGLFAATTKALVADGFTRIIVAGGETSGAVVGALGVTAIEIGPEIAPGVPWTLSRDGVPLALALKSGNFGAPDFFVSAWGHLA